MELALSPRVMKSPFFDCTLAAGADRFSVYNHMLLPMSYGDEAAEYWRLIDGVVMWDVACQVQVELAGPDAGRLAQAVGVPGPLAGGGGRGQVRADGGPPGPSDERSAHPAGGTRSVVAVAGRQRHGVSGAGRWRPSGAWTWR